MAYFLPPEAHVFPHPLLSDDDGFLCIGSEINVENILLAYQFGIFPWNNENEPNLWWFTHPRCVLFPDKLIIHKSMRSILNKSQFEFTIDKAFPEVVAKCKSIKRKGQDGTWITQDIQRVFTEVHKAGFAHSAEVWQDNELVGGVYGIALGKIFFGESMFSEVSNASKFGFIKLVQLLKSKGFKLIDCQQETNHLLSLGAEVISKESFFRCLKQNIFEQNLEGSWSSFSNSITE